MKNEAIKTACQIVGGQSAMARLLTVKPPSVNEWVKSGRTPAERCPEIEKATNGAVRCEDLRPDVDWAYLRNSATATPSRIAPITCGASDPRHAERRDGDRRDDHTKEAA